MPAPRFGYLTLNTENLRLARECAARMGCVVDLVPPDAPIPPLDTYDGLLSDFGAIAPHALARARYLAKLVAAARLYPVVVIDRTLKGAEPGALRAAGIKYFPALRPAALSALLAHPLSNVDAVPAPATAPGDAGEADADGE